MSRGTLTKAIAAAAAIAACNGAHAQWTRSVTTSPMDDGTTYTYATRSLTTTQDTLGRPTRPILIVRCSPGDFDVFVNFDNVLDSYRDKLDMRWRFDKAAPEQQPMLISTSRRAAFAERPQRLLAQIAGASRVLAEAELWRGTTALATFDTRGLARHLPELREKCTSVVPALDEMKGPKPD